MISSHGVENSPETIGEKISLVSELVLIPSALLVVPAKNLLGSDSVNGKNTRTFNVPHRRKKKDKWGYVTKSHHPQLYDY